MTQVIFTYRCPVYVTVDVDSRSVTRVLVDDENAVRDSDWDVEDLEDNDEAAVVGVARRVADEDEWPEWEFGSA